jgi:phospholipid transport system substrate-binding protein
MTIRLRRRTSLGLLGAAVLSAGAVPAQAGDPAAVVRAGADRMLAVLRAGASEATRAATLAEIMRSSFDLPAIGRSVLGRHWTTAAPEQRQRFLTAFEKAEIKAYAARFQQYGGQTLQLGKVTANGGSQMVDSQIVQPNATQPIRLGRVLN